MRQCFPFFGLVQSRLSFSFCLAWAFLLAVPPLLFAHSGEGEAFLEESAVLQPAEVSADDQSIRALEIRTAVAEKALLKDALNATGEVQADETQAFSVTSTVGGVVKSVLAKQGDLVGRGQILAVVYSMDVASNLTQLINDRARLDAEIAKVRSQYEGDIKLQTKQVQLAKFTFEREESLLQEGISARKSYQEAKNAFDSAVVRLETLTQRLAQDVALLERQRAVIIETAKGQLSIMGIDEGAVDDALRSGKVTSDLAIRSPVSGYVVKRNISLGERIEPSRTVYSIVNLSPIWVMVDIYQEQIPKVKVGQSVVLETPSKDRIAGKISSVGSVVDETTKTMHVRIVAENKSGVLRPGMFVTAQIMLGDVSIGAQSAVLVPEAAVVCYKDRSYIYVFHAQEGHFEPLAVRLGAKAAGQVEVLSGLQEGESVVVSGASQLLAQSILKPEAGKQHKGEKHEAHQLHEELETPANNPRAEMVIGFALGFIFAIVALVASVFFRKIQRKA
ncbi:MAG: Cobalt-zinc-cadmium resistance protein CzcB [bacterium ADurb.Bin425]|nr:MAG: Cobalt-zinc-cadmium resistance protein CzcB [bacterium ADurb.Bin425]